MDEALIKQKQEKTKLILSNIYNLPAMSGTMMEITKLLDNPATNSQTLGKMISKDQGIATKILSIANSPLYGLRRKVSTIDFAILVIGFVEIKNIILALSLMESFKNKTDKNLDQKEFWLHSFMTANAAKRIAEDKGYENPGKAFIVGLLHDLGIPVLHKYFHSSFLEIVENVNNGSSFLQSEVESIGYTHQAIGNFLCEKWNLPDAICDAILFHHKPSNAKIDVKLASIVHLADYTTQALKIGNFYWDEGMKLDAAILKSLDFKDAGEVKSYIEAYKPKFEEEINTTLI